MANENIRCIIRCLINFQDGNCTPSDVKRGEVLDVSEDEFHKLSKSGPKHFELIERKFLMPKKEVPVEEVEHTEAVYGEVGQDENMQYGIENIVDWKPVGWYAAQLAREPADAAA